MNQLAQCFPSGLSISRAKKDAKKLKKAKAIPLNQALDEIAQSEMNLTWEQALKVLSSNNYEQNEPINEEVLTLPEAALSAEQTSPEAMSEESCEQSDEQDELLDEYEYEDEDEEKGEVNYTNTIYNSELIAFEEMVDKNNGPVDTFIYPENEVFIQGNGNGTKLWPSPLAATESNADLFCDILNKFSLRIFEYDLINTIYEDDIGETSYEMWYESQQAALSGLAIDAPLISNNESGQREYEKALSRDYGSRKASCHTSNKKLYPDALSVSLSRSLKSLGYDHLSKNKWMLECYPHPAIIECFGLTERHLYKKGNVADKKLGQIELANMISKLAFSNVLALKIPIEMEFYLSESYIKNLKGKALKSNEDALDAIVCLYISGLYAKNASSTTYGTFENGYIWVPQIKCI